VQKPRAGKNLRRMPTSVLEPPGLQSTGKNCFFAHIFLLSFLMNFRVVKSALVIWLAQLEELVFATQKADSAFANHPSLPEGASNAPTAPTI